MTDPGRTIDLLWGVGARGARGPKPGLTIDAIVGAAITIADADGLEQLSMRRVAGRLGAGTMSLYRYVPGKPELLELMVDRVCGETASPEGGDWRARLAHVARENRRLYERHPWLLHVFPGRPPLGPGVIGKYERELRALEGIGLDDVEMDSVLTVVLGHVRGAVTTMFETARARAVQSDEEWWRSVGPHVERVLDPAAFPLAVRVGTAAGEAYEGAYDPEHALEFGLERLLDGIAAFVEARS
jgi:AcrR family transcriptional regulator